MHDIVPAICPIIANEIVPVLEENVLQFHCYQCLDQLFAHIVHDLGIKDIVIQQLRFLIRVGSDFGLDTLQLPSEHNRTLRLSRGVQKIFGTVGRYYGRYDLLQGDLDAQHKQKWTLRKTTYFKKMSEQNKDDPDAEPEAEWKQDHSRDITGGINSDDTGTILPTVDGWVKNVRHRRVFQKQEWWILAELDR